MTPGLFADPLRHMKLPALAGVSLVALALGCAPPSTPPAATPPPAAPPPSAAVAPSQTVAPVQAAAPVPQRWPFSAHAGPIEEGWPIVSVEEGMITVDGEPAGTTKEIEATGRMHKIDEEFGALKRYREGWKAARPTEPFPGRVLLRLAPGMPAPVVRSVFQTAAFAGFPFLGFLVRTGKGEREGVLWADALVPGPPDPRSVMGLSARPLPRALHLTVSPEGITTTWKRGPAVFSEERGARSLLVAPTPAAPATSPGLVELIRQAWTMRGIPGEPGADELPEQLFLHLDDREPASTLIALLDAIAVVRAGRGGQAVTIDPFFSVR